MAVIKFVMSIFRRRWCFPVLTILTLLFFVLFFVPNPRQKPPQLEFQPNIKKILANMSGMLAATGLNPQITLEHSYILPDLQQDSSRRKLTYLMSKGRNNVSIVMGIPTVYRQTQNYLMDTLQNLTGGLSDSEAIDTLIVVFVAETDLEYVLQTAKGVEMRFKSQVHSGLIEVVAPSADYYHPLYPKSKTTLGDSPVRVRWRSKQNLDFAFLMSYCQRKGKFYLQLEDDIVAKPNYVTEMKKFAEREEPWFLLDFCQLGFIGKMFRSGDLWGMIQFLHMFYEEKPADWLLNHLLLTKFCNFDKIQVCTMGKMEMWIHRYPSLFQHVGTYSSLRGKVQNLTDGGF